MEKITTFCMLFGEFCWRIITFLQQNVIITALILFYLLLLKRICLPQGSVLELLLFLIYTLYTQFLRTFCLLNLFTRMSSFFTDDTQLFYNVQSNNCKKSFGRATCVYSIEQNINRLSKDQTK